MPAPELNLGHATFNVRLHSHVVRRYASACSFARCLFQVIFTLLTSQPATASVLAAVQMSERHTAGSTARTARCLSAVEPAKPAAQVVDSSSTSSNSIGSQAGDV